MSKKIITNYFDLPNFDKDLKYMEKKVLEEMNNKNYFQPSLRKIEALKKKTKREEKERKPKKRRNKKIEEDLKSGKKVGIKNRIKFWFRANAEGLKKSQSMV